MCRQVEKCNQDRWFGKGMSVTVGLRSRQGIHIHSRLDSPQRRSLRGGPLRPPLLIFLLERELETFSSFFDPRRLFLYPRYAWTVAWSPRPFFIFLSKERSPRRAFLSLPPPCFPSSPPSPTTFVSCCRAWMIPTSIRSSVSSVRFVNLDLLYINL